MKGPGAIAGSSFILLISNGTVDPMTAEIPNVYRRCIENSIIKKRPDYEQKLIKFNKLPPIVEL